MNQITSGEISYCYEIHFGQRIFNPKIFFVVGQDLSGDIETKTPLFFLANWSVTAHQYPVSRAFFNIVVFANYVGN